MIFPDDNLSDTRLELQAMAKQMWEVEYADRQIKIGDDAHNRDPELHATYWQMRQLPEGTKVTI